MLSQKKLNDHLIEWNRFLLEEWTPAQKEEAVARADFEHKFALSKTEHRIKNPSIASSWAETLTYANEEIHNLNLKRRLAENTVEILRKKLNWLEARADALRSEITSEREEAKLHSVNKYVP
ncbi:MAG: hypothetical protein WDZ94_01770 [Patescibacteria group bacterium]